MKKTIDLTKEALAVYDQWGHKKSEKASQAIVEYDNKGIITLDKLFIRIVQLERRVKELEKK